MKITSMLSCALFAASSTAASAFAPRTSHAFKNVATRAYSASSALMANPKGKQNAAFTEVEQKEKKPALPVFYLSKFLVG